MYSLLLTYVQYCIVVAIVLLVRWSYTSAEFDERDSLETSRRLG